jgi:predicted TIM-barrel fold metal-dependent hydrolase
MPNEFPTHPLEVLRRNVWLNPFWEESIQGLVDLMGPDRVCFGSDFPHPEGLDEPLAFVEMAGELEPAVLERVMSTNAFDLMGLARPVATSA